MTELSDAPILVVGASGGLGREIARALADRGARLALSGRNPERLRATGVEGSHVVVDLPTDAFAAPGPASDRG